MDDINFRYVIDEGTTVPISSIGVGMVTYNAEHRIRQSAFTIPEFIQNFVIVNDGTPYPEDAYPKHAYVIQHEKNMSVGAAKNTAMKYLMDKGCEHIFIIEDDMLITNPLVFIEYIKHSKISGIKHLNFGLHGPANKTPDGEPNPRMNVVYNKEDVGKELYITFYPNCVGAFSYYHNTVIKSIGYIDERYKNAWEHVDHTLQAAKHGFHPPFWYFADILHSWKYISEIPMSIDESTIRNQNGWSDNIAKGAKYFKHKNGEFPTHIPVLSNRAALMVIENIYKNK